MRALTGATSSGFAKECHYLAPAAPIVREQLYEFGRVDGDRLGQFLKVVTCSRAPSSSYTNRQELTW